MKWMGVCALALALAIGAPRHGAAAGDEARASVSAIPDDVWAYMQGRSWRAGLPCPPREQLALLRLPYRDFSGETRMGSMIVAGRVAKKVATIFQEIYDSGRFRIYRMSLIDAFDGDDDRSIEANNTSGFNCRLTDHGGLSRHALGIAIDINPVQNPYREGDVTAPAAGRAYDRPEKRHAGVTGIILPGDVVTRAFARQGWRWGGLWSRTVDYQHFSADGH